MAFNVRIFGYRGTRQMPETNPSQLNAAQVQMLVQPYEWSQVISVSNVAASSTAVPNDAAKILRIEVPDGSTVRYEINIPGRTGGAVVAGNASPAHAGRDQFDWTPGATISLIDQLGLP
jgi:hypothetical protein